MGTDLECSVRDDQGDWDDRRHVPQTYHSAASPIRQRLADTACPMCRRRNVRGACDGPLVREQALAAGWRPFAAGARLTGR